MIIYVARASPCGRRILVLILFSHRWVFVRRMIRLRSQQGKGAPEQRSIYTYDIRGAS